MVNRKCYNKKYIIAVCLNNAYEDKEILSSLLLVSACSATAACLDINYLHVASLGFIVSREQVQHALMCRLSTYMLFACDSSLIFLAHVFDRLLPFGSVNLPQEVCIVPVLFPL